MKSGAFADRALAVPLLNELPKIICSVTDGLCLTKMKQRILVGKKKWLSWSNQSRLWSLFTKETRALWRCQGLTEETQGSGRGGLIRWDWPGLQRVETSTPNPVPSSRRYVYRIGERTTQWEKKEGFSRWGYHWIILYSKMESGKYAKHRCSSSYVLLKTGQCPDLGKETGDAMRQEQGTRPSFSLQQFKIPSRDARHTNQDRNSVTSTTIQPAFPSDLDFGGFSHLNYVPCWTIRRGESRETMMWWWMS